MKSIVLCAIGIILVTSGALSAGDFTIYPGAVIDRKLTDDAIRMSAGAPGADLWDIAIYTTKDPFEKICGYYRKSGKEYDMPSSPKVMKLPSGTELKTQYFLFGGATDLQNAKSWIKVQHPLIRHDSVQVIGPGTKGADTGEIPGVTTIMHMKKRK